MQHSFQHHFSLWEKSFHQLVECATTANISHTLQNSRKVQIGCFSLLIFHLTRSSRKKFQSTFSIFQPTYSINTNQILLFAVFVMKTEYLAFPQNSIGIARNTRKKSRIYSISSQLARAQHQYFSLSTWKQFHVLAILLRYRTHCFTLTGVIFTILYVASNIIRRPGILILLSQPNIQ